jgi:uncharacterized protein with GYD domain
MPVYITRGNYSAATLNAMMAKPEDRAEAVGKLLTAVGGRLHAFYFTFGEYDFMLVAEAPSEQDVLAALITAGSSGAVTNLNTTLAVTSTEMKAAFVKAAAGAAQYRPGGR